MLYSTDACTLDATSAIYHRLEQTVTHHARKTRVARRQVSVDAMREERGERKGLIGDDEWYLIKNKMLSMTAKKKLAV
jgi:hypothetical protein